MCRFATATIKNTNSPGIKSIHPLAVPTTYNKRMHVCYRLLFF